MTDTAAQAIRAWLGIPYATAERFRRPTLLPFNPALPYDQKGPAPLQTGDTSWLEADNGFSENCLNLKGVGASSSRLLAPCHSTEARKPSRAAATLRFCRGRWHVEQGRHLAAAPRLPKQRDV